jgi:predicted NBD/HSP70 family sugar kinase/biotin operon repressor
VVTTTRLVGRTAGAAGQERTQAEVFATIVTRGPLSRRDIARLTGLSQSTITKVVKPMLEDGYVIEDKEQSDGPGRPMIPLRVNNESHYVVGAKIAQRELVAVVTDPQAQILASARRKRVGRTPSAAAKELADLIAGLLDEHPEFRQRVEGLGVGLGGHVDSRTGVLHYSPILGWRDVAIAALLEEATGLYTIAENDVNALAVAEQWFGAGRDAATFAVVTVGVGVGAAFVVDHELVHGASGLAGELGHIVIDPSGDLCGCGNRGCLETIASQGAILGAIAKASGKRVGTLAAAAARARAGEPAAVRAFEDAGKALGRGIAIVQTLLNPERVILSGEGVIASDLLLTSLVRSLGTSAFSSASADCEIVTRPLEDETWARGAASNVLRHLIARPHGGRAASVIRQRG